MMDDADILSRYREQVPQMTDLESLAYALEVLDWPIIKRATTEWTRQTCAGLIEERRRELGLPWTIVAQGVLGESFTLATPPCPLPPEDPRGRVTDAQAASAAEWERLKAGLVGQSVSGEPSQDDFDLARQIVSIVLRDEEAAWHSVAQLIAGYRADRLKLTADSSSTGGAG